MKVWAPENLTSAFRKTGTHPINKDMIRILHSPWFTTSMMTFTHFQAIPTPPLQLSLTVLMKKQKTLKIFVLPAEQPFQFCQRMHGQKQVMATALKHCR